MNHTKAGYPIDFGNPCEKTGLYLQELVSTVTTLVNRIQRPAPTGARGTPDRDEAAERALNAAIGAERRIAQLQQRISQLEELAMTDELTGLLNRRGFETQLQRTLALARRHGEPGLLVYVDLDGFKLVNDTYGHAAGDEVLKQVGRLLAGNVRSTDFVGRLGGDEFTVLLPRTSLNGGMGRVQSLSRLLDPAMVAWNGGTLFVRASIGVEAFNGENSATAGAVLSRADSSMYAKKRSRIADQPRAMAV